MKEAEFKRLQAENARLRAALETIREHMCDSRADSPCSQMWYQDIVDETFAADTCKDKGEE